jgi:hypothetical protein
MLALNTVYNWNLQTVEPGKPANYWKDVTNQRRFFDELAVTLNIQKPQDWCAVTTKIAVDKGGSFINNYYGGSLIRGNYDTKLSSKTIRDSLSWVATQCRLESQIVLSLLCYHLVLTWQLIFQSFE